ncbi:MAG: SRPBCC family protein [Polaromonas sp.]|uniref:SRPBCC family protein n=1 Tax=Polaromonas sp. TaxID=1869339 RepID=UPI0032641BB7
MSTTTQAAPARQTGNTDRIERNIHIKATRSRVWQSISNAEDFGKWFGATLKGGPFKPGQHVTGLINFTVAGNDKIMFDAVFERVEPESLLSYRWHPYAVDAAIDYSKEERTTVVFTLKDAPDGTLLTVVESGFDKVPAARRAEAFRMNSGGWEGQLRNIGNYVAQ